MHCHAYIMLKQCVKEIRNSRIVHEMRWVGCANEEVYFFDHYHIPDIQKDLDAILSLHSSEERAAVS
jgi:hypothetical protein